MSETVHVPLGARAYDIRIGGGLLGRAGAEIAPLLARKRVAVLTDENVAAAHLEAAEDFNAAGDLYRQLESYAEAGRCYVQQHE